MVGSEAEPDRIGGGSGQLESIEAPRRCSGRCSGGQTEIGRFGSHGGMLDGGDDLQDAPVLPGSFVLIPFYSLINNTFTALTTTVT
jgi:hypothetical protein